jgi:hypothetical protein
MAQGRLVAEVTYYRWRNEYGGLRGDQVKRLKRNGQKNAVLGRQCPLPINGKSTEPRVCRRSHFRGWFSLPTSRASQLSAEIRGLAPIWVRDVLHVDGLYDLIVCQLNGLKKYSGSVFDVGGGMASNVSLRELTSMCQKLSDDQARPCPRNAGSRYSVLGQRLSVRDTDDRLEAEGFSRPRMSALADEFILSQ